uniref:DIRP domain-containing protein n=1 Tax=Trichobilharzia regenti TaxID=157069 RepID=A0AA85K3C2_TRIRE|nr:unnamed protein product [Trichobilharzia regenti]
MTEEIRSLNSTTTSYDCEAQSQSIEVTIGQSQGCSSVDRWTDNRNSLPGHKAFQKMFCNMFTTPKFIEWLKHEWLYSGIDTEIFLRLNDFQLILRQHLPTLKTRSLTRAQWSIIRRLIGKPRRFSPTFLSEERHTVQEKRKNMQYIQHLILTSSLGPIAYEHLDNLLMCLPSTTHIPLRLPVGTKVCVSFCTPFHGLYLGVIHDSCSRDGHYGVWIEELIVSTDSLGMKPSSYYGFRLVPEEDVFTLPNQPISPPVTISDVRSYFKENVISNGISVFSSDTTNANNNGTVDISNNHHHDYVNQPSSIGIGGPLLNGSVCETECHTQVNNSTENILISQSKYNNPVTVPHYAEQPGISNSFDPQTHTNFLITLVKVHKILDCKRSSVDMLRQMNNTAEVKIAENRNNITVQFQHTYATLILHLDKLNQELKHFMDELLVYISYMAQEHNMMDLTSITDWRRRCADEAQEIICRMHRFERPRLFNNEKSLYIAEKLVTLLVLLYYLSDEDYMNYVPVYIGDILKELKHCIDPSNFECLESCVKQQIELVLSSVGCTNFAYSS